MRVFPSILLLFFTSQYFYCVEESFTLKAGWNLISIPLSSDSLSVNSFIRDQGLSGRVTKIWGYEEGWKKFDPIEDSTLDTLKKGSAYWFLLSSDAQLSMEMTLVSPVAFEVDTEGWHMVSFNQHTFLDLRNQVVSQARINGTSVPENIATVWEYGRTDGWQAFKSSSQSNPLSTVKPFYGYWFLFLSSEGSGIPPTLTISPMFESEFGNQVSFSLSGTHRLVEANSLPNHATGAFPNSGNPNSISAQDHSFQIPLNPSYSSTVQSVDLNVFGVALNGVSFEPNAAEWFNNDSNSGWNQDWMVANLGFDFNNAHVQPTGKYHYHGIPTSLVSSGIETRHSLLLGYAADGYPIYSRYGYADPNDSLSGIKELQSSYQLKSGTRSGGPGGPGGTYDGTYVEDYEYISNVGDLDECNGRTGLTPDSETALE
ncbi:YHYH protein, partial [bacterium]|nr:YHYH protein [bacterium]